MSKLNPISEERKREIKNSIIKELKGLIFPTIILALIGVGIGFVVNFESKELPPEIIEVNAYTGDGNEVVIENDALKFVMDATTTNFDLTVKSSGKVWHSVPEGGGEDTLAVNEEKNKLQSSFLLTYANQAGLDIILDSYSFSAINGIYDIEAGEDFVTVHYSLGKVSKEFVFPPAMREARFNELTAQMPIQDSENVKQFYKKYDKKALDKEKEEKREQLLKDIPLLETETLYVLRDKNMKDGAKKTLQKQFAAVGYTYEEFLEDKELDQGEATNSNPVFNCDVTYRLDGDDLVVEVPFSSFEGKSDYAIYTLNILPYFGAGGKEDKGSMLVPEGGGSLIRFNNGRTAQSNYYSNLYGWDMAIERDALVHDTLASMNVYGISHENDSFICIMEEGSAYASVKADVSGKTNSYNYVSAEYLISPREKYDLGTQTNTDMYVYLDQIPEDESIVARYSFVDSGSYVDMAVDYRNYLINKYPGYFTKNTDSSTPVEVEVVGAVDKVKQIVGVPVSRPLPLTTYEEAAELMQELTDAGINNLYFKYTGWCNGGVKQKYLDNARLISSLGSKKDMLALSKKANDLGINLYLDGITMYEYNSNLFNGFFSYSDAAKFLSKKRAELHIYSDVTYAKRDGTDPYFLLHGDTVLEMADTLIDAGNKYGTGVSFHDIGRDLASDFWRKDYTSREEAKNNQVAMLKETKDSNLSIMINEGNAYAVPYADFISNMDLRGSEYTILDECIPFYQIALHGYKNYSGLPINVSGNSDDAVLYAAEYGAGLSFSIMKESPFTLQKTLYTEYYASDYSAWGGKIKEIYDRYNSELGHTFNQVIVNHENLNENVSVTEYEDGTKVYVNYGFIDTTVDGVTVTARDYKVVK
ncbi:MAG: DUF5696 domain-containing protein [Lachnospiraceae bacterium]|nr:DUF5696 domain-containing protein [Lachnospiraceae bacterium]